MNIIAFTGKAGSGKSTAGQMLVEVGFDRISFATPIKVMLQALGVPPSHLYGEDKAEVIPWLGKSGRELMQTLGTEWGRELVHPDLWVKALEQRLKPGGLYVIDDLRFKNEAEMVKRFGGLIIRVERAGVGTMDHISEREAPSADITLRNDGCVRELAAGLFRVINYNTLI